MPSPGGERWGVGLNYFIVCTFCRCARVLWCISIRMYQTEAVDTTHRTIFFCGNAYIERPDTEIYFHYYSYISSIPKTF